MATYKAVIDGQLNIALIHEKSMYQIDKICVFATYALTS
jgi:hypothetical protein